MKTPLNKKQLIVIIAALLIGALLAALIVTRKGATPGQDDHEEHGGHAETAEVDHGGKPHQEDAVPARGPHGGKLFVSQGYGLEATIFDHSAGPQFRIYTYQDGKALDPSASKVQVTLERLGRPPQTMRFAREEDYLRGDAVVGEPHSFKVGVLAEHGGKTYRFAYEQVEARVTMSETQVAQNGIDIHTAGPARIKSVLKLNGEIMLNADRTVHVAPRLAGMVESVSANAGQTVRKGQVLAVLSSQALAGERSALLAAEQRLSLARSVFERERSLWQQKITAEQDYQQARAAMQEAAIAAQSARQKLDALGVGAGSLKQLARYEVRAPIDGVITQKTVAAGESVKEEASLFVVADMSTVWAELSVSARDLETIRQGQNATVRAADTSASGTISYVSTLVGEQTRAARARVVLPNTKGVWRPGLPVTVDVVAAEVTVPVAVLLEAVQNVNELPSVFGRYGDHFEARPLVLGRSDGESVEVISGLLAGEKYAAKNSFLIKADLGKAGASHDH
ncbi:efflux RND transporter periplasmic adaptor subunit [Massilia violaceinigra]|uniref:Efflux RND transporter periplasmic adaptor subunit n=1 Tax=Massilia violaceinigra TaxID=2045208 RepID=A0ABY4A391_9BURK|nr:efflux RND transporter periplasmic adaptor subunit [Massilia violaceinigra]UOD29238.1 efflux RND transporter periplasmic adaptor subunit [Massilia violaceinigra]